MKTSAASVMSLVLLLAPSGAARSEIELESFPVREKITLEQLPGNGNMSTPASSTTPKLPIFGETTGGNMCPVPDSWLNEGGAEKPGEKPFVDHCRTLENRQPYLPEIMDHLGWTNGAALMRGWFNRSANDDPVKGTPDNSTITMDWVLGYQRARDVYDKAVNERVWVNAAARALIENKLIRGKGKLPVNVGDIVAFGSVGAGITSAAQMQQFDEDYHFQHRPVNSDWVFDPLDDLYAALANFNFQFVTEGTVKYLGKDANGKDLYEVTLDKVGIYVKDSYDFNDDPASLNPTTWISQPLGYWDCAERTASKTPDLLGGSYYVDNDDFREWRDQHGNGMGGDFLVFSDIRVINVNDTFTFTR
jgi:hypothetical protein